MTDDSSLLRQVIAAAPGSRDSLLDRASTSTDPSVLVAAALLAHLPALLIRANGHARTPRDRQLVALAHARLSGDDDLLDALLRDHLSDHPDSLLAAWIAADHTRPDKEPS